MCQTALIFLIVQVFLVFLSIIPTEVQLNRQFDRFGRWRSSKHRSSTHLAADDK